MDFTRVELNSETFVYDGTEKELTLNLGVKDGDNVTYTLSYSGTPKNVDSYNVTIAEIGGDDAIYYNMPSNDISATLTITKINISVVIGDENLNAENIKKGVNIFGVAGGYEGVELDLNSKISKKNHKIPKTLH